jgi:hypothetical protein
MDRFGWWRRTDGRIHFFFGTRNLRVQILMTGLLALVVFSELWTVIAIERPFTGTVKVEPTALSNVLADFGSDGGAGAVPAAPPQH